jgi:hypothetical protein
MDKLSSTDAGHFSDAVEVVNRPHIIIRKIEIDNNSNQEFESEVDTPVSGRGVMSSQRSLAQSKESLSRGSILSREPAKGFNNSQAAPGSRSPKKLGKSVLYTDSSVSRNPSAILKNFVDFFNKGTNFQRDFKRYIHLHDRTI